MNQASPSTSRTNYYLRRKRQQRKRLFVTLLALTMVFVLLYLIQQA